MNHCRCQECREDAGSSIAERSLVESRRVMSGLRLLVQRMIQAGALDERDGQSAVLMDRMRHLHHLLNTTNQPRRERS